MHNSSVVWSIVVPTIVSILASAYSRQIRLLIEYGPKRYRETLRIENERWSLLVPHLRGNSYELIVFIVHSILQCLGVEALMCVAWFVVNAVGALFGYHIPLWVLGLMLMPSPTALALSLDEILFELEHPPKTEESGTSKRL